jgi:hypothetical protein
MQRSTTFARDGLKVLPCLSPDPINDNGQGRCFSRQMLRGCVVAALILIKRKIYPDVSAFVA